MKNNGPDPYEVLHIAPTATRGEVARAYRALMRRRHPDTRPADEHHPGPGSTPELEDIMAAYAILGNPEKRALYDRDHARTAETAQPPHRQRQTFQRPHGQWLPAASLLIGPVLREPPPGRSPAMPAGARPNLPPAYTLIWRIGH